MQNEMSLWLVLEWDKWGSEEHQDVLVVVPVCFVVGLCRWWTLMRRLFGVVTNQIVVRSDEHDGVDFGPMMHMVY